MARFTIEHGGHDQPSSYHRLLAIISNELGAQVFSARELIERAHWSGSGPVLLALVDVGATNPKRLGKLFQKLNGQNLSGLSIERVVQGSAGAQWAVRPR
jgi:hypothetical protein